MGAGLAVGAAVADGELGSVMGSMLLTLTGHKLKRGLRAVCGKAHPRAWWPLRWCPALWALSVGPYWVSSLLWVQSG